MTTYDVGPTQAGADNDGLPVAALVLGILSVLGVLALVGGLLLGPAAIGLAVAARRRARRAGHGPSGLALAGLITGIVGLALNVVLCLLAWAFALGPIEMTTCTSGATLSVDGTLVQQPEVCTSD